MVEEVNKIIYNMLIGGKGVLLPGVGTLYIERQGAKRISKDRLLSPRNAVNFSSQAEGRSIVDEIVAIAGCGEEQARDIYDRWLAKTREGKRITIGGVGVLNDKSFSPEAGFNAAINPGGVKTLVVRQRSNVWLYAVSGVCVAVALCVGAYMMWGEKLFGGVSVVGSDAQTEMTAQVTADSTSAVQGVAGDSLAMAEAISSETATQTASTASTAASESTAVVSGGSAAATDSSAVNTAAAKTAYRFWVVAGVFSTEQNATDGRIVPFKGKFIAALFGSDSRADCNAFARSYKDIYPDLWIYEVK